MENKKWFHSPKLSFKLLRKAFWSLVDNKYIQFFKYPKREAQVFCVIYSEQRIVIVVETHNLKKSINMALSMFSFCLMTDSQHWHCKPASCLCKQICCHLVKENHEGIRSSVFIARISVDALANIYEDRLPSSVMFMSVHCTSMEEPILCSSFNF